MNKTSLALLTLVALLGLASLGQAMLRPFPHRGLNVKSIKRNHQGGEGGNSDNLNAPTVATAGRNMEAIKRRLGGSGTAVEHGGIAPGLFRSLSNVQHDDAVPRNRELGWDDFRDLTAAGRNLKGIQRKHGRNAAGRNIKGIKRRLGGTGQSVRQRVTGFRSLARLN